MLEIYLGSARYISEVLYSSSQSIGGVRLQSRREVTNQFELYTHARGPRK